MIGPIAARYPTVLAIRRSIADTRQAIGISLVELGRPREAVVEYRLALPIYEGMVEENRTVAIYRERLAACLNSMALVQDMLGDRPAAVSNYELSIVMREQLAREDPSTLLHQYMLADSFGSYADYLRRVGDRDGARENYRRALEVLRKVPSGNVIERYNRACYLAQYADLLPRVADRPTPAEASQSRVLLDEAMTNLRGAVRSGFGSSSLLDNDHNLDILRGRDDFRAMRQDLSFPSEPFAR